MRTRRGGAPNRGRQLGRRLALLAVLSFVLPLLLVLVSGGLTARAAPAVTTPGITLMWKQDWNEVIDAGTNLRSYHLVGEVRNDTGANATGIQLHLNLFDSANHPVGSTSTVSSVEILAPGELSPFEAILFPPPASYDHFEVVQPISFAASVEQPDHSFNPVFDACPNPSPTSADCQEHMTGHVQNPSTSPPAYGVAAIFTFYDPSNHIVAQNRADVINSSGGTSLAPGQSGTFMLDRPGEPAWSTRRVVIEPDYPIEVNPAQLDFGGQRTGTPSPVTDVALINNSDQAVNILSASASGDFAVASQSCSVIAPRTSCRVNVRFTPSSNGLKTGTLTVTENAAGTPNKIPLTGTGVAPLLTLDPTSLAFSPQGVGTTSSAKTVKLLNSGNDTLNIFSLAVTDDYDIGQCPATLAPAAFCMLSVTFSPQSGGPRPGTITITDDAAGSPHTVPLTGTGLGPGVAFNPTSLDFGGVSLGTTSPSRTVQLKDSGSAVLAINDISTSGDFTLSDNCPRSPATLAPNATCTITVKFTPTAAGPRSASMVVTDNAGDSPQVYSLKGLGTKATYYALITKQASLVGSDGVTWQPIDPALSFSIKPPENQVALLSGNADLWTANSGVNQDLGIMVSVGGGQDTLLFWKESGGFAGTFSPNAAYVQGSYSMQAGFTYVFKLVWKANHAAPGTAIFAGAGPIGNTFSPTRLTAQLVPAGVSSAVITTQKQLAGSDGTTWTDIDATNLAVNFNGSLGTSAVISANADLWTATSGINQDLGIFVTSPGGAPQLVAWKESGGSAGTFSPNAAFVQTVISTPSSLSYHVSVRWKTNVRASGSTIVAGAGPINGRFSPTTLTVQLLNNSAVDSARTTNQATLAGSNGSSWTALASLSVTRASSSSPAVAVVGANADLWTNSAGYNQDLGIFLSIDGGADATLPVGWKESGGFAGVYSPNAAFAQAVVPLPPGHSYKFTLKWKTNRPEGSATIASGAGPIGSQFSPTSLVVQVTAN